MFRDREFFSSLLPATGKVILGDGKTSLPIEGVGTVKCLIGSNELTIENVQYIQNQYIVSSYMLNFHNMAYSKRFLHRQRVRTLPLPRDISLSVNLRFSEY